MSNGGPEAYLTPEARARIDIDAQLAAAGWVVQDYRAINLAAIAPGGQSTRPASSSTAAAAPPSPPCSRL